MMKKILIVSLAALLLAFAGCQAPAPLADSGEIVAATAGPVVADVSPNMVTESATAVPTPEIVHEGESVQLIRAMMAMDYADMPVAAFNDAIFNMCEEAGTTVFAVISDTYDHFYTMDENGYFLGYLFTDAELEAFFKTTLAYSSSEIFGQQMDQEIAHLGQVTYAVFPGKTAWDVERMKAEMGEVAWLRYLGDNAGEMSILSIVSYAVIETAMNAESMTVAERDERLGEVRAAMEEYVWGLTEDQAASDTLEEDVAAEFERIAETYSDDDMAIACRVQSVEHDIGA